MFEKNRITSLLGISYPIIQGGMVWVSGWRLASAVSNAGGLGVIGAGSMNPALLLEHISKCKKATDKPFGVNIPLLYRYSEEMVNCCIEQKVPVVITSAGNPKTYTQKLKDAGIKVIHVVASSIFAQKAEAAGVDAIVAEGFEAGGHNGREETTTMVLIPAVVKSVQIPVIAAGGIATGSQMLASFALGAEGVQIGTRFIVTMESSAHDNFKHLIIQAKEGDTLLSLKSSIPTRLYKNELFKAIEQAEKSGATPEQLKQMLGEAENKAKTGMFDGDIDKGMLEVGQNISLIDNIKPVKDVVEEIIEDYKKHYNLLLK
ncbi:MAG TPA: nitronate monooxygenase [Bacteroidales bacterium]|nr:nitronate monooxygenase [Bacteroidales bacterium]